MSQIASNSSHGEVRDEACGASVPSSSVEFSREFLPSEMARDVDGPSQTPTALLEDSSLCTSTVNSGIEQEVHRSSLASSNSSETCSTSMPSSPLELLPSEMSRDIEDSSCLSENLDNRAVELESDEIIANVPPLSHFHQIVVDKFPDLKSTMLEVSDRKSVLEITHRTVHHHPPAGYVYRVRIVLFVSSNEEKYCYDIQALLVSVKVGAVSTDRGFVELCNGLLHSKGFVFCPGIGYQEYHDNYYSVIRFHSKQVNLTNSPFKRVDSKGCLCWYQLPKNATLLEKSSDKVLCSPCKRLVSDLECQKRKSILVSPRKRSERQLASSNYPTKYLSPASVKKRIENAQVERSKDKALLANFSKLDVTLDDFQHDEMCRITAELENNHKDQLEDIYKEAGNSGDAVKDIWRADKERADFYKDQMKNGIYSVVCKCYFKFPFFCFTR